MIKPKNPFTIGDFSGGINQAKAIHLLNVNEAVEAVNCYSDTFSLKKIPGYTKYNPTNFLGANPVLLLAEYTKADGSRRHIAAANGSIMVFTTTTATDITGTYPATTTGLMDSVSFVDTLIIANNGESRLGKYTGVGAVTEIVDTDCPEAYYVEVFENRLIAGRTDENPSRIYYSNLRLIDEWDASSWIDCDKDAGGRISGLETFYNELLIFKTNGIFKMIFTGNSDVPFALRKITDKIGCVANNSIVQVENIVYFVSSDGIYSFDGNMPIKISHKVDNIFYSVNYDYLENATAVHIKPLNQVWFALPEAGEIYPNMVLAYNYLTNSWFFYTITEVNGFLNIEDNGEPKILSASRTSGYIMEQLKGTTFDGANIPVIYVTGMLDMGTISYKRLTELISVITRGDNNAQVTIEIAGNTVVIDNTTGAQDLVVTKNDLDGIDRFFQISISQTGVDYDWEFNQLTVKFMIEERE